MKNQKTRFSRIHFSSKTGKWNTPDDAFNDLNQEFHFVFDPCIPPKVGDFKGNGLKEHWYGNTFCNMPYDDIDSWVEHGWEELCDNNTQLIVFLIPFRNSNWLKFLRKRGAELRTANKRLKFGNSKDSAPFDSLVAILTRKNVLDYWKRLGIAE